MDKNSMDRIFTAALRWSGYETPVMPPEGGNPREYLGLADLIQPEVLDPENPYTGTGDDWTDLYNRLNDLFWRPETGMTRSSLTAFCEALEASEAHWKTVCRGLGTSVEYRQWRQDNTLYWDSASGEVTDGNGTVLGTAESAEACLPFAEMSPAAVYSLASLEQYCVTYDVEGTKKQVSFRYFELRFPGRYGGELEVYGFGKFPADGSWVSSLDQYGWRWGDQIRPGAAYWYWPGEAIWE